METNQTPYILFFRNSGPETHEHLSADDRQLLMTRWNAWYDDLAAKGKAIGGTPLELETRIVAGPRGERVVDGPFAEAKEAIGGYVMLMVADLDEATAIAQRHPGLPYGSRSKCADWPIAAILESVIAKPQPRGPDVLRPLSILPNDDDTGRKIETATGVAAAPAQLVENFFRHETGRLHGALIRLLGTQNLTLAEDVAQEAMLRALRTWSMGGIPQNPSAWIMRVAMNLAKDALRHQRMATTKEPAIIAHLDQTLADSTLGKTSEYEIRDDALRLMFVCCHPAMATDAQVVLALKVLCGFSTAEIARAFLSSEAAIEKQLTRTRGRIQEAGSGSISPTAKTSPRASMASSPHSIFCSTKATKLPPVRPSCARSYAAKPFGSSSFSLGIPPATLPAATPCSPSCS